MAKDCLKEIKEMKAKLRDAMFRLREVVGHLEELEERNNREKK